MGSQHSHSWKRTKKPLRLRGTEHELFTRAVGYFGPEVHGFGHRGAAQQRRALRHARALRGLAGRDAAAGASLRQRVQRRHDGTPAGGQTLSGLVLAVWSWCVQRTEELRKLRADRELRKFSTNLPIRCTRVLEIRDRSPSAARSWHPPRTRSARSWRLPGVCRA